MRFYRLHRVTQVNTMIIWTLSCSCYGLNKTVSCFVWNEIPQEKMVLVTDNSPYNYERGFSSLSAGKENNSLAREKTFEKIDTWTMMCTQLLICFVNYPFIVKKYGRLVWKIARTTFVSICERTEGYIRSLVVDDTFRYESIMLPVATLVVELTKDVKDDVEFLKSENI